MAEQRRRKFGLVTGTGLIGLTLTSGLSLLAHYFVNEFSRPHVQMPETALSLCLPHSTHSDPPPALQRSLLFTSADGVVLRGDFWAQPRIAPTVVLCHGYRSSRTQLRSVAAIEYACGYNVLRFDFRGHGESDSVLTSAGNAEVYDLEAAIQVARQQPETRSGQIILHGFSMGAAVALLTQPHSDVVAIIADSPYAYSDDIMRRIVYFRLTQSSNDWVQRVPLFRSIVSLIAWYTVALSVINFRLRFGYTVIARPKTSLRAWKALAARQARQSAVPVMLMHSSGDMLIPIGHAHQLVAAAKAYGVPLETYFADINVHCGAYGWNPSQYHRVLLAFLTRCLRDDLPEQHQRLAMC